MIEKQLLKIRSYRNQKAERFLSAAQSKLKQSKAALLKAKEDLALFIPKREARVASLYQGLIGKSISLEELEKVRLSELNLYEREAALAAKVGTIKETIEENKKALQTAKQQRMVAQKNLNKAEEIIALRQEELKTAQQIKDNNVLDEFRVKKAVAFALLFLCVISPALGKEKPVYRAINHRLPLLLEDVATRFDLKLKTEGIPNVPVNNEYPFNSPSSFFAALTENYQLDWFIYEDVLYITPQKKRKTRQFSFANEKQMKGFSYYLTHRNLLSSSFPVVSSREKAVMRWTAPEVFLRTLAQERHLFLEQKGKKNFMRKKKMVRLNHKTKTGHGVMIFYLTHAWANDKEYKFGDSSYKVPGVASMVRRLIGARGGEEEAKVSDSSQASLPAGAGAGGVSALEALGRTVSGGSPQPSPPPSSSAAPHAGAPKQKSDVAVLADERLNAVLIYDQRERYDYYHELITHLDKESELVEIEAMIVDVAKNHINELGINWRVNKGKDGVGFGEVGENLASNALAFSLGAGGLPTALSGNLAGILARIRFLETKGNSRIISRPSVMTMDNLEAVINTTQRFYVRIEGYQDSSLYPVEAGTTMKVTPHIVRHNEGEDAIRLFVTIEDGAIDTSETAAMIDNLPTIQENKVKTQAVIRQGQSLLIGGHIHTTKSQSSSRVPVLSDIPLLGRLFRSDNETEREFIRLFIIRPRIYEQ